MPEVPILGAEVVEVLEEIQTWHKEGVFEPYLIASGVLIKVYFWRRSSAASAGRPPDNDTDSELEQSMAEDFDAGEESGLRTPLKVADPKLPSAEEVEAHNLTHLPYRSWCPHCVRGKGKTMDHRLAGREKVMRELHVDYCFMVSRGDDATKCIIVAE